MRGESEVRLFGWKIWFVEHAGFSRREEDTKVRVAVRWGDALGTFKCCQIHFDKILIFEEVHYDYKFCASSHEI